jgi:hypothetical protein
VAAEYKDVTEVGRCGCPVFRGPWWEEISLSTHLAFFPAAPGPGNPCFCFPTEEILTGWTQRPGMMIAYKEAITK